MDTYLSFRESITQTLGNMACFVIILGAVETWAAWRGFSRPLAVGLIVLAVSSTVFYLVATGPHGAEVLQATEGGVRDSYYVMNADETSDIIHKVANLPDLSPFFALLAIFLIVASFSGGFHGETLPTTLRILAAAPFIYYAAQVLKWTTLV